MIPSRRGFLIGLGASLVAAPAIVRAPSLMQIRGLVLPEFGIGPWMMAVEDLQNLHLQSEAVMREVFRVMAVPPQWLRA